MSTSYDAKFERKNSEISRLRRSFLKKFNSNYRQKQADQTAPKGIYIRHVSKRPKSPFRKYELAAMETTYSNFSLTKRLSASASELTQLPDNSLKKSNESTRKVPIENEQFKSRNYKPINNLEDLVIACVDAPPLLNMQDNKNMIYYKKKYLFNLAGSNWNLFSSEVLDEKVKKAQERRFEIKKSASHSDIYEDLKRIETEENDKKKLAVLENKKDELLKTTKEVRRSSRLRVSSKSKGMAPKTPQVSKASLEPTVQALNHGMTKQYARVVKLEPLTHEVTRETKKTETEECGNFYYGEDFDVPKVSTLEIEKKPLLSEKETDLAEHFMKSLIDESLVLRKKIADGDDDVATLERLKKILTLKKKYEQYKTKKASLNTIINTGSENKPNEKMESVFDKTNFNNINFKAEKFKSNNTEVKRKVSLSKSDTKINKIRIEKRNSSKGKEKLDEMPFTKMVLMKKQMRTQEEPKPLFGDSKFLTDLKRHPLVKL